MKKSKVETIYVGANVIFKKDKTTRDIKPCQVSTLYTQQMKKIYPCKYLWQDVCNWDGPHNKDPCKHTD